MYSADPIHDFTIYNRDITHLMPIIVNLQSVREAQRSLHQTTVTIAMDVVKRNRVINRHPSPIAENERQLPRVTRTILAQLRSGWANILNSYRTGITLGHAILSKQHTIRCISLVDQQNLLSNEG